MKETALRKHFERLMEFSPHVMLSLHNKGETVSTLYSPARDERFTNDMFDDARRSLNEKGKAHLQALNPTGIKKMTPDMAEKLILESQKYFRLAQ